MLKMIKLKRMKQGLLTLLLISVLMMTLKSSLEPSRFQQPLNTVEEHCVLTKDAADKIPNISSDSNSRVIENTFPLKIAKKSSGKSSTTSKCGYDKCPKTRKDLINIHLIPHSHDDPGFKKTIDEYYHGTGNFINNFNVSRILHHVIHQLTLNKDRKFIYVEVIFFSMWWNQQTESTRDTVRDLVQNGRLEFVNGGWCVNDEASPNYADIIDQMSLGLNFLAETFGECGRPKVAFQGDTFGHSREQALLSSLMGFDALFMGRVDEEDKNNRKAGLEMEMIWFGSDLPGKHPSIFTGITYNTFDPPPGFCFDKMCGNGVPNLPINDDIHSKDYNAEERVNIFLDYCTGQAKTYKTNNIAVYMGSDFTYEDAEVWFVNMDKLIRHINDRQTNGSNFNIFYSTPACYAKAVNEANVTWPTKKDDFLPYHGFLPAYWSGHFSSRPSLKYMIRKNSGLLQSCKQMASILKLKGAEDKGDLSVMKEAMAVLQHHDAITGTHSQRVSDDYVRILHKGVEECTKTMNSYYQMELPRSEEAKKFNFPVSYCSQLNISQCEVTNREGNSFVVNVYNPLGKYIDKYIRVPVIHNYDHFFYNFQVINSNGKTIPSDLMPIARFVASIPGRNSSAHHELIFLASKLPPLGSKSYYIEVTKTRRTNRPLNPVTIWNSSNPLNLITNPKISNEKLSLALSNETGRITSVTFLGGSTIPLDQQFFWYNGNGEKCSFTDNSSSGVYVFNPLNDSALPINIKMDNVVLYQGELVEEIHQAVNDYVGQIIRLYKGQDYIEFDWVIGPVPIEDGIGKEIITRYSTNVDNNGTFYTDSNGRQSILRIRDQRLTYNVTVNDPSASNYYPITSHAFLTDAKSGYRMNVLTDRAQGGGSIQDGQLEFLIHRRLLQEDLCFFAESLNETAYGEGLVVRGTHKLFFENTKHDQTDGSSSTLRSLVQQQSLQPEISFFAANFTSYQWRQLFRSELQLLSQSLPENVKLLTFEPRSGNESSFILRLEHIYDVGEHVVLSRPTEVSLKDLFNDFIIEEIEETTLDGNVLKSDLAKLIWKSKGEDGDIKPDDYQLPSYKSLEHIQLMPMEIRTFIIRLSTKKW